MARGHFRHKDTLDAMARKTRGQEIFVIRRTQLTFNIAVTTKVEFLISTTLSNRD